MRHCQCHTGVREFFAAAPATVSSMVVAGDHLFVIDGSGSWNTHALYNRASGLRVASDDWRNGARDLAFAPGRSRVYLLFSGVSPTDIAYVDVDLAAGTIGDEIDSEYHGDYSLPSPLRLLPDESLALVGSGNFFDMADLAYATSFGLPFTDVAFDGGNLVLVSFAKGKARVRELVPLRESWNGQVHLLKIKNELRVVDW